MIFDRSLGSLREWPVATWESIVAKANATVLSKISDQNCDAYLLSESSLFVYSDRLVMITCGETSLITAVEEIFRHAELDKLRLLVFERKNEMLPHQQRSDFEADVAYLNARLGGSAMRFGVPEGNFVQCYYYSHNYEPDELDFTLEILMHDLNCSAETRFVESNRQTLYGETEIHQLFPGFQTDDFFFEPMGYSLNSIGQGDYYTIHVTPQSHCSYASFETNHHFQGNINTTIHQVLSIFKPKSFSILLFESQKQPDLKLDGYQLVHEDVKEFAGYRVRFFDFVDTHQS